MSDLPPGWTWTTLGDACNVVLGQSPPGSSYNASGDGLPFFQGKAEFGTLYPAVQKWTTAPKKFAELDDVLLSVRAPVGPTNLAPVGCAIGRGLAAIQPSPAASSRFILWWMRSSAAQLAEGGTGTTFKAVTGAQVRAHPIPLPPRAEQERIVAALEEHLSRLDAAEASVAQADRRVGHLSGALLERAVSGTWPQQALGDLLLSLKNGCFVSRPASEPPGLPIYRISAVRPLHLDIGDVRYAPETTGDAARYMVEAGDLLFTRYSGNPHYVGACAVVPSEGAGRLHPDKLIRGIPDATQVISEWVALAVSSSAGRREIEGRLKTTAGQVGISGGQLKSIPIPVPPLQTQRDRIHEYQVAMSQVDAASRSTEWARTHGIALRQSILAAAFSGKLVPQDPSDEPASILLERIRAERATSKTARRPKAKAP